MYQRFFYFLHFSLVALNRSKLMNFVFLSINVKDTNIYWKSFIYFKFYFKNFAILLNMHESNVLHVLLNSKWVNDVRTTFIAPHVHVLDFAAHEKVVDEAVAILLAVIAIAWNLLVPVIDTINPAQVIQRSDVVALVRVINTEHVSQVNTLSYVRDLHFSCV